MSQGRIVRDTSNELTALGAGNSLTVEMAALLIDRKFSQKN
jgi:hypothetical protein